MPVASVLCAVHAPLTTSLALTLMVTADADLSPRRYVVTDADANAPLVAPLPVRVSAILGFTLNVAGLERER
jgi:hypothetical protein